MPGAVASLAPRQPSLQQANPSPNVMVHSGSDNLEDHIRPGLNTAVPQDSGHPWQPRTGAPDASWTSIVDIIGLYAANRYT
ncbi:MAG TPA: hypothetical protein VNA16_11230 [Abditibacteriaceae bacterium]|nr:hypothetical protein [Abditibacteriaceae bacterium]